MVENIWLLFFRIYCLYQDIVIFDWSYVCLFLLFHLSLFMCLIVFTKVSYNMIFSLSGGWPDCLFDHFITECKLCYSTSVNRVNCVNSVNCVINSNSVNCVNVTNVLIFILTLRCCFFQLEKSMLRLFI